MSLFNKCKFLLKQIIDTKYDFFLSDKTVLPFALLVKDNELLLDLIMQPF